MPISEEVAVKLVGQVGDLINKFVGVQAQLTTVAKGIEDRFAQASRSINREMNSAANASSDSFKRIERAASGPKNSLAGIADAVVQVRGAIIASGIAVLFREIASAVGDAAERAQKLNDTAQLLEFTGSQLQGLQATAIQAGFPLAKLDSALFKFNTTLQAARDGSDEAQRFLAAFGVTTADLQNAAFTTSDALLRVSASMREYGITSESTAVLGKIFGKENQAIAQVLLALSGSFAAAEEAARRYGTLTDEQRASLARFAVETAELNFRWQNLKDTILSVLVPALEFLGLALNQLYQAWRLMIEGLLLFVAAANVVIAIALKLLQLDFEGAKQAWRSYGETVSQVFADIEGRVKSIIDNQEKMQSIVKTGSPVPASGVGAGSQPSGAGFKVPGKTHSADDVALEKLKLELEAARAGSAERIAIADRIVAYVKQKYGEESREFFAALRARQAAEREHAEERRKLADDIAQSLQTLDQDTRSEVERNASGIGSRAVKELNDDLERRRSYAANIKKINKEIFQDSVRTFEAMLQPVTQAISTSIQGIILGTQNARQALAKLGQSILLEFIDAGVKALTHHIATQLAMTQATAVSAEARAALEEDASKKSVLSTAFAAVKIIATKAAQAMASVYAAIAGIPVVGPFLAPTLAVAAGATVLGFIGKIASARGGFEVPKDQLAMVHEQEMVLPAPLSKGIKDLIAKGGSRGRGDTYVVNAVDARSVERFFDKHGRAAASALRRQAFRFNTSFRPA